MPINSSGVITPAVGLNALTGERSGATRASDFSVCGDVNHATQLKVDLSGAEGGANIILKAPEGATGTIELTLPTESGTVVAGGVTGPETSTATAVALWDDGGGATLENSLTLISPNGHITTGDGVGPVVFEPDGLVIHMSTDDVGVVLRSDGASPIEASYTIYGGAVGPGAFLGTVTDHDLILYTNNTNCVTVDKDGDVTAIGDIAAATMTPANGATGSFTTTDGKTVTVTAGIITDITGP